MNKENKSENKFGNFLRTLRLRHKIGLRELANKANLSPAYISRIENGECKPPSTKAIIKISNILEISSDYLLQAADKLPPDITEIILGNPLWINVIRLKAKLQAPMDIDIDAAIKQLNLRGDL